jgi:hypothetical protein
MYKKYFYCFKVKKAENIESSISSISKPEVRSRLPGPKTSSLLPSKLQPAGINGSSAVNTSIPGKSSNQIPQKAAFPGNYGQFLHKFYRLMWLTVKFLENG